MKVLNQGHTYFLHNMEAPLAEGQLIHFIQKEPVEGDAYGTMLTTQQGTSNEEVLEMLIDRMNFLQNAFPCRENAIVITKLEESLMWLNKRTTDRMKRGVEGKHLK